MTIRTLCLAALGVAVLASGALFAQSRTIGQIALNRNDYTVLTRVVTAAGYTTAWEGTEMYTVFTPSDLAFAQLPAGTVDTLMLPANKARLTSVLTYHVVPGRMTSEELAQRIQEGGGSTTLTTLNGGTLTATMQNGVVVLRDAQGGVSTVTATDATGSNGVVYSVDRVLMP